MNIYLYTKSGHNVGLESARRAAVLFKQLKSCDPILCTADYRAATFARELGVHKGIGIDIIGNLPNIMEQGDMLIFDSDEPSETMRSFMKDYCTLLYEVGVDIPKTLVDDEFFKGGDKSITKESKTFEKSFFFGDDDYKDLLLKMSQDQEKQDISLLMGHYFFLGNEDKLAPYFKNIIDEEDYFETIFNSKYLLTSSINAAFESLASGNCPVFYQRADKSNEDIKLIKEYNIPIIEAEDLSSLISNFNKSIENYPDVKVLEKVDTSDIINNILEVTEKFKAIMPSLEINY